MADTNSAAPTTPPDATPADPKWLGRSRAFAAVWLPVLALVLKSYWPDQADAMMNQLHSLIEASLVAGGALCALLHKLFPDGRPSTLLPKALRGSK